MFLFIFFCETFIFFLNVRFKKSFYCGKVMEKCKDTKTPKPKPKPKSPKPKIKPPKPKSKPPKPPKPPKPKAEKVKPVPKKEKRTLKIVIDSSPNHEDIIKGEHMYSEKLKNLVYKIKNQSLDTDYGIRFGWKNQ